MSFFGIGRIQCAIAMHAARDCHGAHGVLANTTLCIKHGLSQQMVYERDIRSLQRGINLHYYVRMISFPSGSNGPLGPLTCVLIRG
jgi:hypothetical protein